MRNLTDNPIGTLALYALTAVAEIGGCYLFMLFWRTPGRWWVAAESAASLLAFAWLLTLHPAASGRVYAAYGGVYVAAALVWLWVVDGVRPDRWDVAGGLLCLTGMLVIYFGPRGG
jgi:small multidrug resistance family-3 protein